MNARLAVTASVVVLSLVACGTQEEATEGDDTWVGTITTEGDVATIVNESGSVWGNRAQLVEEATIGVEAGEPAYMLARISSVAADEDHIYVLETRPPVLRVYDMNGRHIRDIGRKGQGPGEFELPNSVAVVQDGRLLVRDDLNGRISVFRPSGELVESWSLPGGSGTIRDSVVADDGTNYHPTPVGRSPDTNETIWGYVGYDLHGAETRVLSPPDFDYEEARLYGPGGSSSVPFHPHPLATLSPSGAWVTGVGHSYRFHISHLDGRRIVVERVARPVVISTAEREWHTRRLTARWRSEDPSWRWNGPPVPDTKPFFVGLYADLSGRIWVTRSAPSSRVDDCTEDPRPMERVLACWEPRVAIDVFDVEGRYLGEVEFPDDVIPDLTVAFIRGDMVLHVALGSVGPTIVRRYRLVLPRESF